MHQASLFAGDAPQDIPDIPGLRYLAGYVSADEAAGLIAEIDAALWRTDLKRRVQHYGYEYYYRARRVTAESRLGPLPGWLAPLAERLAAEGIFAAPPDQVIINEYLPGQGISAHVDCVPCFGETIASLGLGSDCLMRLAHPGTGARHDLHFEERGLVVLAGPARHDWTHAIPARKSDVVAGARRPRQRRLSLTFRTVTLDE